MLLLPPDPDDFACRDIHLMTEASLRTLQSAGSASRHAAQRFLLASGPRIRSAIRRLCLSVSPHVALAPIILVGVALRVGLLSRDVPTLDSDEATVGLMAIHLLHGEWTTFFWGQSYMGSLEAVLIAPFIWAFGASAFTLRLAPMLVGMAFIVTVYALGVRLYRRGIAIASTVLLAVGPPFFVVLSVRAYGGYVETLLFGNLLLLIALHDSRSATRRHAWLALQGLIAGLALWTNPLILPYCLAVGAIYWWRRRADLLGRNGIILCASVLVGAAPAVVYNLMHAGATFTTIAGLTLVGARGAHTSPISLVNNIVRELLVSLPIVCGGFIGGVHATGLTDGEFVAIVQTHIAAYALALSLAVIALVCLLHVAVRLVRERRVMVAQTYATLTLGQAADDLDRVVRVRWQGEAALVGIVVCYLGAFCLTSDPLVYTTPRYLLPVYSATPIIVAEVAQFARHLQGLRSLRGLRIGALAAGMVLMSLLAWNGASDLAIAPIQTAARDHGVWISGQDRELLRVLRTHDVRTVISNDYWRGMRLTFESEGNIITVMVTPNGKPGFNRYQPYVQAGLHDPRPAYVEIIGTVESGIDLARLRAGKLAHYESLQADGYTVIVPAPQAAVPIRVPIVAPAYEAPMSSHAPPVAAAGP
jgi:4-amino-4-deoxy-L-arabinose transferase-like glycosyltransferase